MHLIFYLIFLREKVVHLYIYLFFLCVILVLWRNDYHDNALAALRKSFKILLVPISVKPNSQIIFYILHRNTDDNFVQAWQDKGTFYGYCLR